MHVNHSDKTTTDIKYMNLCLLTRFDLNPNREVNPVVSIPMSHLHCFRLLTYALALRTFVLSAVSGCHGDVCDWGDM